VTKRSDKKNQEEDVALTEAILKSLGSEGPRDEGSPSMDQALAALVDEELPALPEDPEGVPEEEETAEVYRREATALRGRDPERAAQMFLEAALACERDGACEAHLRRDLEDALTLQPDNPWLLAAVRRLLLRLNAFEAALDLCLREVELLDDAHRQVPVLVEAAALERHVRGDEAAALALVKRALALEPNHVGALMAALALQLTLQLPAEVAATCDTLATALSAPVERALILYLGGTMREALLQDYDSAEAAFSAAVEADPEHLPALSALVELQERRSTWRPLVINLGHLIDLIPDHPVKALLLDLTAALHLDHRIDVDLAARLLTQAVHTMPPTPAVLWRLVLAHDARQDHRESLNALRQLYELRDDAEGKAEIARAMAWLAQEQLDRPEVAIGAYRKALGHVAGDPLAYERLRVLLDEEGLADDLVDLHRQSIAVAKKVFPAAVAVRQVELAELLDNLARPREAIDAYLPALEEAAHHVAFWGADRLFDVEQRHSERAHRLESYLSIGTDIKTANHLRGELARLLAGPLNRLSDAIGVLAQNRNGDANRTLALQHIAYLLRAERFQELVDALLAQANDTRDAAEAHAWLRMAGHLLADEVDEPDAAIAVLQRIIAAAPGHPYAMASLVRIAHEHRRWPALVAVLEHALSLDPSAAEANVLHRHIAWAWEAMGEVSKAIEAYQAALEVIPADAAALRPLDRLLRKERRWKDLVGVLERYAEAEGAQLGHDALCHAAECADLVMGDSARAMHLYRRALAETPESKRALYGLLRVRLRQKKWTEVRAVIDGLLLLDLDGEERSRLLLALARVREFYLGEAPDLALYTEAATATRFEATLRGELTRVRRLLGAEDLPEWLETLGHCTEDTQEATALFLESAQLQGLRARSLAAAFAPAAEAYQRSPDDLNVLWAMERVAAAADDWGIVAQVRERFAHLAANPAARVQALAGAILAYVDAGEDEQAARVAQTCLKLDAHCMPALLALALIYETKESWRELATVSDRLAEASHHDTNRYAYCLWAAELWTEKVGDDTSALASLGVALSHHPAHPQALAMTERLLEKRGDHAHLARVLARAVKGTQRDEVKIALLRKVAALLKGPLEDPARASAELAKVLAIAPDDREALSEQAGLLQVQGRWSEAIGVLERLAACCGDPLARRAAKLQQAQILIDKVRQPGKAKRILRDLRADFTHDVPILRELFSLADDESDWDEAKSLLDEIIAHGEEQDRVWAAIRFVDVARRALWSDETRKRYESQAISAALEDRAALNELLEDYRQQREIPRLISVGQSLLSETDDDHADPAIKATVATLMVAAGQHREALAFLSEVIRDDLDTDWAFLARAQALEGNGQHEAAVAEYRRTLRRNLHIADAYTGLIRALDRLGHRAAADTATLVFEHVSHGGAGREALAARETVPGRALDLAHFPLDPRWVAVEEILLSTTPHLRSWHDGLRMGQAAEARALVSLRCRAIAAALALPLDEVRLVEDQHLQAPCVAQVGLPLSLEISKSLAQAPHLARFDFWVTHAMCQAVSGGALLERLPNDEVQVFFQALLQTKPLDEEIKAQRKRLFKVLPRAVRKPFKSERAVVLPEIDTLRAALQDRAAQAAAVLCGVPPTALSELPANTALLHFMLSEAFHRGMLYYWGDALPVRS